MSKYRTKRVLPPDSKCPPGAKLIPLTRGLYAIVDAKNFEWLNQWNWYAHQKGNNYYAARRETCGEKKLIYMHRLIMGARPGQEIDHISGNGLDNRLENVRFCTHSQNARNSMKRGRFSSKYKGVSYDKNTGKWRACICNGKNIQLGSYNDEHEAATAYDKKAQEFFGEFAKLNFPEFVNKCVSNSVSFEKGVKC